MAEDHGPKLSRFEHKLSGLKNDFVQVLNNSESSDASVALAFSQGARLQAEYWRLTTNGHPRLCSFDHQQEYGLPAPIDALQVLRQEIQQRRVVNAQLDRQTGDLLFEFSQDVRLQIFNFTGYEIWEISFPDGTGEYSNYIQSYLHSR